MSKIVLLAVVAAWIVAVIPPLLRSRVDNRPNSSVTDFRRQLSTLQRAVPTRGMSPMRSAGRQLAQTPLARPVATSRSAAAGPTSRSGAAGSGRTHVSAAGHAHAHAYAAQPVINRSGASLDRPMARTHAPAASQPLRQREVVRRRRANVLGLLVLTVGVTGFLYATTKATSAMYATIAALFVLLGYCYRLIQLRNQELDRLDGDESWSDAA